MLDSAALNVLLTFLLIFQIGINGAVVNSVLTYTMYALY
jgi:hypothetical protein